MQSYDQYFQPDESEEERRKKEIKRNYEKAFQFIIIEKLLEQFTEQLEEADFDSDEIEQIKIEFAKQPIFLQKQILSIPAELRTRNFPLLKQQIVAGTKQIQDVISTLKEAGKKGNCTLGYHTTNRDILPSGERWFIRGLESDDRDNLARAYYSLDYEHIFRAKPAKFLFVVRAALNDESHILDKTNNWGRASTLPIIQRLDLQEIDNDVRLRFIDQKKQSSEK
jgi:hypothetical protein